MNTREEDKENLLFGITKYNQKEAERKQHN